MYSVTSHLKKQATKYPYLEAFQSNKNILNRSDAVDDGDFIDCYLDEIIATRDKSSSFYHLHGLQSLECDMIDLFLGIFY